MYFKGYYCLMDLSIDTTLYCARPAVNQGDSGRIALVGSGIGINSWQPLLGQTKKTEQNFENMRSSL
jgi:hypothetical protein